LEIKRVTTSNPDTVTTTSTPLLSPPFSLGPRLLPPPWESASRRFRLFFRAPSSSATPFQLLSSGEVKKPSFLTFPTPSPRLAGATGVRCYSTRSARIWRLLGVDLECRSSFSRIRSEVDPVFPRCWSDSVLLTVGNERPHFRFVDRRACAFDRFLVLVSSRMCGFTSNLCTFVPPSSVDCHNCQENYL
jgi:hypothetical protein